MSPVNRHRSETRQNFKLSGLRVNKMNEFPNPRTSFKREDLYQSKCLFPIKSSHLFFLIQIRKYSLYRTKRLVCAKIRDFYLSELKLSSSQT